METSNQPSPNNLNKGGGFSDFPGIGPIKNWRTAIIIAATLLLLLIFWRLSPREIPREVKKYQSNDYGFELQYPYDLKDSLTGTRSTFTGSESSTEALWMERYSGENINKVIDAFKEKIAADKGQIVFERDIKINNCTFRKIIVEAPPAEPENHLFIPAGGGTVEFSWIGKEGAADSRIAEEITSSIKCR